MRAVLVSLLALACFSFGACSLFGNYDLEGLPCDRGARKGEECIPDSGFVCVLDGGDSGYCARPK